VLEAFGKPRSSQPVVRSKLAVIARIESRQVWLESITNDAHELYSASERFSRVCVISIRIVETFMELLLYQIAFFKMHTTQGAARDAVQVGTF
jgi:hypothetical protein